MLKADQAKKLHERMSDWLLRLSKTEEGLQVLRYLYLASGFNKRTVVVSRMGNVDRDATFWNDARRDNYLDLRQFMTAEVIKVVELDIPKQDKEGEENDARS